MVNKFLPDGLLNPSFQIKDFDKFFVGFDDQFNRMAKFSEDIAKSIPNYPPYNIIKHDENHYTIELAIAGFGQQDIDIEMAEGKLIVKGNVQNAESEDGNFLFKGIANRAFTRSFVLNDEMVVHNAELFNGMLKVFLERIVPETKKPKKIAVKTRNEKQLLNEEKQDATV